MKKIITRNKVRSDEYYFSVALNGLEECGVAQTGEFYMNFQGDRPNVNTGVMPVCMFKVFDNFTFKCKVGGLDFDGDYRLKITFTSRKDETTTAHKIIVNGVSVYEGAQYGGEKDKEFDAAMLCNGFETATYVIPKELIHNGCIDLEFSEPQSGVMFSEFWITHE